MKTILDDMLALIEQKRLTEHERILHQAQNEAAILIAEAHRKARARMRDMVNRERHVMEQALRRARSQEETERRNHALSVDNRHLEQARSALDQALLERWREPESRKLWITSTVERAMAFLPTGEWEIHHPSDLDPSEWQMVEKRLLESGLPKPQAVMDASLQAGMRLGCQGAWVDGSAAGVVANRLSIDAGLLALMHAEGASS
ncbi:MAG: hypothetical protein HQL98_11695 [Magnetococcales bacterium]|nr:hypothetical protein [Magnetococcales bacterium]